MAPVQTTQTLADAQQAHKDLQAKHTALKVKYETDERVHRDVLAATEQLRAEQVGVRDAMDRETAAAVRELASAGALVAEAIRFLGEIGASADRHLAFVADMQTKVAAMQASLDKARAERDGHHAAMVEEEHAISVRRSDLGIYERRLDERIAAAGLQNEIKLL